MVAQKKMTIPEVETYCAAEVLDWVRSADAHALVTRICSMEGKAELDRSVLQSLGSGTATGVILSECSTGAEKAAAREAITDALCAIRPIGLTKVYVDDSVTDAATRTKLLRAEVKRKVKELVDLATADTTKESSAKGGAQRIVVARNEEESQYSVQEYTTTESKQQLVLVQSYFNLRLQAWQFPTLGGLKKIMYSVKIECQFADPSRITLEMMRRSPTDTYLVLLVRLLYGHVICAAGMAAPPGLRDEGAGKLSGDRGKTVPAQWAQGEHIQDLLSEVMEVESRLKESDLRRVCKLIQMSLHKATTSRGGMTLSLAARSQCGTVAEMCIRAEVDESQVPRLTAQKRTPAKKRAREAREKGDGAGKGPKAGDGSPKKYPDEKGAMGPNKLPRMKGGNPAGDPCKRLKEGGECPFSFCSYSHK